jgi:iron complex transport system substrate-binding protein
VEKANEILEWHQEIKNLLTNQDIKKKQKIIALQFSKDRLRAAGGGSYENFVIELIGSENPAKNDIKRFADISKEQLLVYNPDIIILGSFDSQTPDEFISQEMYQGLDAVKNKKVYKFPVGGFRWGIPHIESPLTWLWLNQLVNYNKDISLINQMRERYKMLYNYEISDAEIKHILKVNIHQKSKNYKLLLEDIK